LLLKGLRGGYYSQGIVGVLSGCANYPRLLPYLTRTGHYFATLASSSGLQRIPE
jgi:hypothetical protein